jgi:molybdopterin synthase sulfur carrier subunit
VRTIRLYATLRLLTGRRELEVAGQGGTVAELVHEIAAVCPELGTKMLDARGELTGLVQIFVGGRNIRWLQGLQTPITPEDEVVLFPPVGGG